MMTVRRVRDWVATLPLLPPPSKTGAVSSRSVVGGRGGSAYESGGDEGGSGGCASPGSADEAESAKNGTSSVTQAGRRRREGGTLVGGRKVVVGTQRLNTADCRSSSWASFSVLGGCLSVGSTASMTSYRSAVTEGINAGMATMNPRRVGG